MKLKKERKVAMNGMSRQGLCVKEEEKSWQSWFSFEVC
jgi:hypothetical protein